MSHYDDIVETTEDALQLLNDVACSACVGYLAYCGLAVIWHVCATLGQCVGVLLWIIVHSA